MFTTGLPKCVDKDAGFFEQEGLVFSSKKLLKLYVTKQVKNGSRMINFKLGGRLKARIVADEITDYALHVYCDKWSKSDDGEPDD